MVPPPTPSELTVSRDEEGGVGGQRVGQYADRLGQGLEDESRVDGGQVALDWEATALEVSPRVLGVTGPGIVVIVAKVDCRVFLVSKGE